jgi:hypothetical protein
LKWEDFKLKKENRFDGANVGGFNPIAAIQRARRQIASNLREMINDGEINEQMTVSQILNILEGTQ